MTIYENVIYELNRDYEHYSKLEPSTIVRGLTKKLDCEINIHETKLLMSAIKVTRKYCVVIISANCKN